VTLIYSENIREQIRLYFHHDLERNGEQNLAFLREKEHTHTHTHTNLSGDNLLYESLGDLQWNSKSLL